MKKFVFSILISLLMIMIAPYEAISSTYDNSVSGFYEKELSNWGLIDYTLLYSTNFNNNYEIDSNNLVIICEDDFNLSDINPQINGYCNETDIVSTNKDMLVTIQSPEWYKGNIQILISQSEDGFQQIAIPKTLITTPTLRKGLLLHFTSLGSTDQRVVDLTTNEQRYSPYLSLVELSKYTFSTLIILSLLVSLIAIWNWYKNADFYTLYHSLLKTHKSIKPFIIKLIVTLITFLPLFIIISIIYLNLKQNLIPNSIHELPEKIYFLLKQKDFSLLLASYLSITFTVILIFYFDVILRKGIEIVNRFRNIKMNNGELKRLIYCFIILLNITIWIFPNKVGVIIGISLLLLLIPIIWLAIYTKDIIFKIHEIVILSVIIFTIAVIGVNIFIDNENKTPYPINLFESTEIVTLPYTLQTDSKIKFTSRAKKGNFPVFANEFLVYNPNSQQINSLSFLENIEENIDLLLIKDKFGFIKEVTSSNKSIKNNSNVLLSNPDSLYFRFSNPVDLEKDIQLELTINCDYKNAYDISLQRYDQKLIDNGLILSTEGCDVNEEYKSYKVPVDPNMFKKDTLYKLNPNKPNHSIINYKFTSDNRELLIRKFDLLDNQENEIGYYMKLNEISKNGDDNSYNVVTFGYNEDYNINLNGSLFDNINTLIENGLLSDTIILWTTEENAIIYESDMEDR